MPITTAEQRTVLDAAHQFVGAGSLIPANKIYIQQRHAYDGQCKAAGLSHMHGLRHRGGETASEHVSFPPHLLDELARLFAHAALDQLLEESVAREPPQDESREGCESLPAEPDRDISV